jgi:hypothetical protein
MLSTIAVVAALAAAQPSHAAADHSPSLRVKPKQVQTGETLRAIGRGWPARVRVHLMIGPPNSEASHAAWTRTTGRGRFRKRIRMSGRARPGVYVMLACRRECAFKRSARFEIVR